MSSFSIPTTCLKKTKYTIGKKKRKAFVQKQFRKVYVITVKKICIFLQNLIALIIFYKILYHLLNQMYNVRLSTNLNIKSFFYCALKSYSHKQTVEHNFFTGELAVFFTSNLAVCASVKAKSHVFLWKEDSSSKPQSHSTGGSVSERPRLNVQNLSEKVQIGKFDRTERQLFKLLYLARFGRNAPTVHSLPSLYSWSFDFLCYSLATDRYLNIGNADCFHSCYYRVIPMYCRPHRGRTVIQLLK